MPSEAFPEWFRIRAGRGEPTVFNLDAPVSVTVVRDPAAPSQQPIVIGIFPVVPPGAPNALTLGAGNILISATQVASNSPPNTATGFAVTSGALTFPGNINVINGVVHIGPNDNLELDVQLNPPAAPAPVTGPGADASAAVVNLPASVKILFAPAGATIGMLPRFTRPGLWHIRRTGTAQSGRAEL
jgi:hypothetical protein